MTRRPRCRPTRPRGVQRDRRKAWIAASDCHHRGRDLHGGARRVGVASYVAHVADTQCERSGRQQATGSPSQRSGATGLNSPPAKGAAKLILLRHSWVTYGQAPPTSGSYLRVEVELICDSGSVDYDPYNFQVFDETGRLFETAIEGAGDSMLETGTLHPGERIRGTIAFDMPHSEATLLMSDDTNQTVTALKVPD